MDAASSPTLLTELGATLAPALQSWSVARLLRESLWAYPVVSTLHLLGIALLLGGIAVVDARLLGFARSVAVADVARAAWPFSVAGVVLAVGTGPLLFVVQPAEYLVNRAFFWKLLLLCAALANVALFHARFAGVLRGARPVVPGVRLLAALSLLLWLGVLCAGRMIAFV
jgi:hypothetical protein